MSAYLVIFLGFPFKHIKSIGLIISHGGLIACTLPMDGSAVSSDEHACV
jgi:hypothetical protein